MPYFDEKFAAIMTEWTTQAGAFLLGRKTYEMFARDTALRIDGPLVAALQGVFSENWLEASGEILAGDAYYPVTEPCGTTPGLVIRSSPADRATVAHMTFYAFISSARGRSISARHILCPIKRYVKP